jgi:uncharacterized protein YndB with AHSA1/START domain
MATDRLEREVLVNAPIERVWEVLTEPDHLTSWYAFGGARIDLRPGGTLTFQWDEHGVYRGRVETVDRPRAFSFRYAVLAPDTDPADGNSTCVEFSLLPEGDATRLRLVERGFDRLRGNPTDIADHARESAMAWDNGLAMLREHAATPGR